MFRYSALFLSALAAGVSFFLLTGGSTSDDRSDTRIVVWAALTIVAGAAFVSGLKRSNRDLPTLSFCAERLVNKTLAISSGWLLVFGLAAVGVRINLLPAILFVEDTIPILWALPILVPTYILTTERIYGAEDDAHASFGALLRGKGRWIPGEHKTLVIGWTIKAFFLPLMYGNLAMAVEQLLMLDFPPRLNNWVVWFTLVGLTVDLLVGTVGYLCAGKLFRCPISNVDESAFSWIVCLICYAPFFQYLSLITAQKDSFLWTDWLSPDQPLYWIWAALIVACWAFYCLSSVAFGFRFSNLTYRGLIDRGPYKFLKHPAYLSKNIYWWLHTVPFFGVLNAWDLFANLFGLSVVSLIYYVRAKAEERYLTRFPEYADYARRIGSNSLLSRLECWSARRQRA